MTSITITITIIAAFIVVLIGFGWAIHYVFYQPGSPRLISLCVFALAVIFLVARFTDWISK